jgi:hypothetical protein
MMSLAEMMTTHPTPTPGGKGRGNFIIAIDDDEIIDCPSNVQLSKAKSFWKE